MGPIKEMAAQTDLSLETDPVTIHRKIIQEEELTTGQKTKRKYDVDAREALEDQQVQKVYRNSTYYSRVYHPRLLCRFGE